MEGIEAGWSVSGYLANVGATNGNPLQRAFAWMAATPWFVEFVDVAVPCGELLVGPGSVFDALTRLAAFFGAFVMALFYFGNWDIAHGYLDGDLTYVIVFLVVAVLGASSASTPTSSASRSAGGP